MSNELNSAVHSLVSLIDSVKAKSRSGFRANMLVNVVTLRLLLKAAIVTADEAVAEIEAIKTDFSEVFGGEDIAEGAGWAVDLLRGDIPLHGSPIKRHLQAELRDQKKNTPANLS